MLKTNRNPNAHFVLAFTVLLPTLAVTAGCGDKDVDSRLATQVVARVNGEEITVHQINHVLEQKRNISPEAPEETKRKILDGIINQQLAMQMAIENKLDRSPKVMRSIEAAKNEILARAYLEQVAQNAPQFHDWDLGNKRQIESYYSEHPELFAHRRLFTIEEIIFGANEDVAAGLRQQMSRKPSMQQIADWLKSREIEFAAKRLVRAAEQMSLEHLPKVQKMAVGEIQLFKLRNGHFQVIRVVTFKEAPVDKKSAAPRIAQYLANRQSREMLAGEIQRMREQAQIEYLGEFSEVMPEDEAITQSDQTSN